MTAYQYLERIQSEVGPRRAGTQGEVRARAWLRDQLEQMELTVEEHEYRFVGSRFVRYLIGWLQVAVMVGFLALTRRADLLIIFSGILLYFIYFSRVHSRVMLRLARTKSQNLLAGLDRSFDEYIQDPDRPLILLCAHYDTPLSIPGWVLSVVRALRTIGPLLNLIMLGIFGVLAVGAVLSLLERIFGVASAAVQALEGFWVGVGFWVLLAVFGLQLVLISTLILDRIIREHADSPGADDNGSGVSLVLEMAERLKEEPPENARVHFAFWGAEELGLYGSRQFVREYGDQLDKETTYIINADVVGVGEDLLIHTGQGVIFRRRTEPEIVAVLESICREQGVAHTRAWESLISGGSSDHAEWAERGFRKAISLLREKPKPPSLPARILALALRIPHPAQYDIGHVHTAKDTIDVIRPEVLSETVAVCEQYVRWIDGRLGSTGS